MWFQYYMEHNRFFQIDLHLFGGGEQSVQERLPGAFQHLKRRKKDLEQGKFPVFSKQPTKPSRVLAAWHFLPLTLTQKYILPEEPSHSSRS